MKSIITGIAGLLLAGSLLLAGPALSLAQSLKDVSAEECVSGDCQNGRGILELETPFGKGRYEGNFRDGEFDGFGRLEVPVSFTQREVYVGHFAMGQREGRGTHWNGKGDLYIGDWANNERNGRGTYAFKLAEWRENQHTEFWLKDNTENYTGEFLNDNFHGEGVYRWKDGQKYVGGFYASDKHGPGTFFYSTGTARQQLWNYGDFVR